MSSRWYLLVLVLHHAQTQGKLTCNDLAKKVPFKYNKLLGDWNTVFAYKNGHLLYDCRRLKISNITSKDIEYFKSLLSYNSTIGPIGWRTLKLRVEIYKKDILYRDFALLETSIPGRMHGVRIPHFFQSHDIFGQNRVPIQMNVVQDYLVAVSCRFYDVNVYARGAPHVTRVQRFLDKVNISWSSGRPVCVPGTVEVPESTVNVKGMIDTDIEVKNKPVHEEL